ncbi:MAG TPA: hypothetical protein ENO25_05450 [Desulfobacteraceae bacterium]|nr:hypothetical protein [Desulfobacteraceae bacterium]
MAEDRISSSGTRIPDRGWKRWTPRLLAGAVGMILLAAGLLKSTEMEIFIRQIRDYGIISPPFLLVVVAWGLIVAECVLGTALMTGFLPRITIPVSALLILLFLCATAWAWLTGVTGDCGCFGSWISRTPGEALLEDLVLLAALFPAWLRSRFSPGPSPRPGYFAVAAALLVGLFVPLAFGIPFSSVNSSQEGGMNIGRELSGVQGLDHADLSSGEYLMVLIETDCPHCRESVEKLNILAEDKEAPELIALCPNDEEQVMMFRDQFQPAFPVARIDRDTFWRLLGDGDIPRTILVRNQEVLKVWNHDIPGRGDIMDPTSYPYRSLQ